MNCWRAAQAELLDELDELGLLERWAKPRRREPASWRRTTGMNWTMMNWCARPSSMFPSNDRRDAIKSTCTGKYIAAAEAAWIDCSREMGRPPERPSLGLALCLDYPIRRGN